MKKIIILFLIQSAFIFSQTDCQNSVSTDFTNPFNTSLPTINGSQYLNSFDWFPIVGGIYDEYQTTNITFGGVVIPEMNSIMTTAYMAYKYIWNGPLPLRENGWELLLVNLGRYPDDVTAITAGATNSNKPYIVLYNRYSAIIRIFVNYGLNSTAGNGANDMMITLTFEDPESEEVNGNLRLYNGRDQALNDSSSITSVSSIVLAPAEGQNWASADFKIAYDPCVCYTPSKLRFDFEQIAHTDIQLHGRSITLADEPLINGNLGSDLTDFLNGFDTNGNSSESSGMVMHKSLEKMINDYHDKYKAHNEKLVANKEHNAKVKRNLAILKMAKYVIAAGQVAAGGISFPTEVALATTAAFTAANESINLSDGDYKTEYFEVFNGELFTHSPETTDTIQRINWFKAVEYTNKNIIKKTADGVKKIDEKELFKAVKLIFGEKGETFIENNFELRSNGTAPTPPTATFSEMHYVGNLSSRLTLSGFNFYTPGTYGSIGTKEEVPNTNPIQLVDPDITSVYEYPVYNEALGIFALLKTPKVNMSTSIVNTDEQMLQKGYLIDDLGDGNLLHDHIKIQRYQSWTYEYQFKLAENLEYALNDVLDIKDYSIDASFNIIAIPEVVGWNNTSKMNCYNDKEINVNIESNNTDANSYNGIKSRAEYAFQYKNNWYPWDLWDGPNDTLLYNLDTVEYQTPYVPINAFHQVPAGIGLKNVIVNRSLNDRNRSWNNGPPAEDFTHPNKWEQTSNNGGGPYLTKHSFDLFASGVNCPSSSSYLTEGIKYNFKIQLKLAINVEFNTLNSDGNNNEMDLLLTYDIPASHINENPTMIQLIPNLANSGSNITQFPENYTYSTTHFTGQNVAGCRLNGNNYTCKAWNDITINGDISVANNYSVEFIAGNQIDVIPTSNITPEAILRIEPILDYSHPMPKATQSEVTAFCDGTLSKYKANIPIARFSQVQGVLNEVTNERQEESPISEIDFTLYPNPTNADIVSLQLVRGLDDSNAINITMHDLTGRLIQVKSEATGAGMYTIDIANLAPGTYFVTGSTYGSKVTKRLIVQ